MPTLTATTNPGHGHSHYITTKIYLLDINNGLPRFHKDVIWNQLEPDKDNRLPERLQNVRSVRDLVINTDHDFTTDEWIQNIVGIFITVSGIEQTIAPDICTKQGSRRFGPRTIVADNAYKGELKQNSREYNRKADQPAP
ncbi:unnamed protein product [Discula destructiva]